MSNLFTGNSTIVGIGVSWWLPVARAGALVFTALAGVRVSVSARVRVRQRLQAMHELPQAMRPFKALPSGKGTGATISMDSPWPPAWFVAV